MRQFSAASTRRTAIVALAVLASLPAIVSANDYPVRPVRIVVPYGPGGAGDVIARLVAQRLSSDLKQQVIVDNRPGGAGVIGATAVARSPADGYTLLLGYTSEMVITPTLLKSPPYNTQRDFIPVAMGGSTPLLLVASSRIAANTLPELMQLIKAQPGGISYATAGNGSPAHIAGALLAKAAGAPMLNVPYKGGAQAVTDVLAGNVDVYFSGMPPAVPHVKSGRLKAIGVASKRPAPSLPDVPALAVLEPSLDLSGWFGFFAPAGTPSAITALLHQKIVAALSDKELQTRLLDQGVQTDNMDTASFVRFVEREQKQYADHMKQLGITAE